MKTFKIKYSTDELLEKTMDLIFLAMKVVDIISLSLPKSLPVRQNKWMKNSTDDKYYAVNN